jgi:hypothetical protein
MAIRGPSSSTANEETMSNPTLQGFYLSFSGESSEPINNLYALSTSGATLSTQVLDPARTYQELRGMAFDSKGYLYVCQAQKEVSAILQFSSVAWPERRTFCGQYATPSCSSGLLHPYQPIFRSDGNLYVSSQDTNVVTGFHGPASDSPGKALPSSKALPPGTFNPGTFVPAYTADPGVPDFTPVPASQGGLTLIDTGSSTHSVRGVAFDDKKNLYVADEGNNRVGVYDASGRFLGAITESSNHSVQEPVGLWFDLPSGLLYIGSPGNNRVFTYAVSNLAGGSFKANVLIHDSDRLDKVSGITVDASGHLYTCSRKTSSVYQWSAESGHLIATFASGFSDTPEQIIPVYA